MKNKNGFHLDLLLYYKWLFLIAILFVAPLATFINTRQTGTEFFPLLIMNEMYIIGISIVLCILAVISIGSITYKYDKGCWKSGEKNNK